MRDDAHSVKLVYQEGLRRSGRETLVKRKQKRNRQVVSCLRKQRKGAIESAQQRIGAERKCWQVHRGWLATQIDTAFVVKQNKHVSVHFVADAKICVEINQLKLFNSALHLFIDRGWPRYAVKVHHRAPVVARICKYPYYGQDMIAACD